MSQQINLSHTSHAVFMSDCGEGGLKRDILLLFNCRMTLLYDWTPRLSSSSSYCHQRWLISASSCERAMKKIRPLLEGSEVTTLFTR